MTECPSHETQTGDEGDENDKENREAPAGADAARADEGFCDEPFERLPLPPRLRRKGGRRFRRG